MLQSLQDGSKQARKPCQSRDRKRPKLLVHTIGTAATDASAAGGAAAGLGKATSSSGSTALNTSGSCAVFTPPELLLVVPGPSGDSSSSHTSLLLRSPAGDSPAADATFAYHPQQFGRSHSFSVGAVPQLQRSLCEGGNSPISTDDAPWGDDEQASGATPVHTASYGEDQQQQQHRRRRASCGVTGVMAHSYSAVAPEVQMEGPAADASCDVLPSHLTEDGDDDKENCGGHRQRPRRQRQVQLDTHYGASVNPSCLPPLPPQQPVPHAAPARQRNSGTQDDAHNIYNLLMQSHHTSIPLRLCNSTQLCLLAQQQQQQQRQGSCCGTSNSSPAEHGSVGSCAWDVSSQTSGLSSYASLDSHLATDQVPLCTLPVGGKACKLANRRSFAGLSVDTGPAPGLVAPPLAAMPQAQQQPNHSCGKNAAQRDSQDAGCAAAPERAAQGAAAAAGPNPMDALMAEAAMVDKAQHGWFSRCRGCAQLTGHEYLPGHCLASPAVPLCAICSRQLLMLDVDVRMEQEAQLMYIHGSWLQHGL